MTWKGQASRSEATTQAQAVGDLYGQYLEKIGRTVKAAMVKRKRATVMVTAMATMSSNVHRRITMPMRKSTIVSWRSAGIVAIVASTFQDSHASNRICRTSTFSRGAPSGEFQRIY